MLFTSFVFYLFLLIVFFLYYLPFVERYQVFLLLAASLLFYAWNNPWYLILLLSSCAINIYTSFWVSQTSDQKRSKRFATIGVVANLLILSFFKYAKLIGGFFVAAGVGPAAAFLDNIPLAIGISFYTFEGISLLVDVSNKKNNPKNIPIVPHSFPEHAKNVMLFISFFPHLIAGPILKAKDFIPQIQTKHFNKIDWELCFKNLVMGYFLKMVVADNLKDHTFWISSPYFQNQSSLTLLVLVFGYSSQIFSDFAGYSLIALGLAGLFGYSLEQNFNYPYISRSFSEFWRRWHISLSSFLREYLYIPLGGNRKGNFRTYLNLFLTMVLGGLWHGAAWSYAVWGGFHGMALALERFAKPYIRLPNWWVVSFIRIIIVYSFVTLAWLLFKLPNFSDVKDYVRSFFDNTDKYNDYNTITYIVLYSLPVIVLHSIYLMKGSAMGSLVFKKTEFLWYGVMLALILVNSGSSGSFIYFQF